MLSATSLPGPEEPGTAIYKRAQKKDGNSGQGGYQVAAFNEQKKVRKRQATIFIIIFLLILKNLLFSVF